MARFPLILCAAFAAAALTFGVYELLRDEETSSGPVTLDRSQQDPASVPSASSVEGPAEIEAPAPIQVTAPNTVSEEDQEAAQRRAIVSDTLTLFDRGLHAEEFAQGESWQVGLGLTDEGTAFPNDRVSAVEIPAGLQATLFDEFHGQGFKLTLGPGRHDLTPYAFNDRMSSIEVSRYGQSVDVAGPEGCVVLYEHRGADLRGRGLAWKLELPRGREEWTFRASRKEFDDDQASTAWVAQGFELVLFDDPEGNGVALVLGPGLHELELLGFNDRASSARVRRVR